MSKWMAVAALGAMMAVVGCDNNKDDAADPMKMSQNAKSHCSECAAKKDAEPKKLSAAAAAAAAAKSDCQTQCPAGAAKAK